MGKGKDALVKGEGILRLAPVFVPRRFGAPGRRLRLHPDDYYAYGTKRGAIKERWFSSIVSAENGEDSTPTESMSYVAPTNDVKDKFLFKDAVDELGAELIGQTLMDKYGTWPVYSKFFDYYDPLFHHLHLTEEAANRVGKIGKPECYYFPPQMNNYAGSMPATYFGFSPDVTKEQVKERLAMYREGDNRITELSRAYRIELGTGWYTPPGVVHAPGSSLTYEPQWNSDVNSVYENIASGEVYPYSMLVENCPPEKMEDLDYVISLMDWEKNIDPDYRKTYFRPPIVCRETEQYTEKWIAYKNDYIGAKELTIQPYQTITHTDEVAFGCIFVQGNGKFGNFTAETATTLRFGQLSNDEFFVSEAAAKKGFTITNNSCEPMVILKHFANNHPDMPR